MNQSNIESETLVDKYSNNTKQIAYLTATVFDHLRTVII